MPLQEDGIDPEALDETLSRNDAKLLNAQLPEFARIAGRRGTTW
ncbi:MAG TPA: hypothetical protein PLH00_06315 [Bacteroidaceae bacterium]|nr:hypothetical protein [Bacteroidaceae bacterium]